MVSRGGYDALWDPTPYPTIFVVEPTHEAEPWHHFGPGCTKLFGVNLDDIIELKNEDHSCKLEIDGWEMIWYVPDLEENFHFDVWLTRDGIANICLSVLAGTPVSDPF